MSIRWVPWKGKVRKRCLRGEWAGPMTHSSLLITGKNSMPQFRRRYKNLSFKGKTCFITI